MRKNITAYKIGIVSFCIGQRIPLPKGKEKGIYSYKIPLNTRLTHSSRSELFNLIYVIDLFLRGRGVAGSLCSSPFVRDGDISESLRAQCHCPQTEEGDMRFCPGAEMATRLFSRVALCLLRAGESRRASRPGFQRPQPKPLSQDDNIRPVALLQDTWMPGSPRAPDTKLQGQERRGLSGVTRLVTLI